MRRRPRIQEVAKRAAGRCFFCPESRYAALECHRIVEGANGGRYVLENVLVCCSTHHSLITAGVMRVHASHRDSLGRRVIHWTDEFGNQRWDKCSPHGGPVTPREG